VSRWHEYSAQKPSRHVLQSQLRDYQSQWWPACGLPHYSLSLALEASQEYPGALSGNRRVLFVYRVVDFHIGLQDDLVSRLFDFASLYTHDWLHLTAMMQSIVAVPEHLRCEAPTSTCEWGIRSEIANQSLTIVHRQLDALEEKQQRPILRLPSTHIDWT
jgi:hypothetical protein